MKKRYALLLLAIYVLPLFGQSGIEAIQKGTILEQLTFMSSDKMLGRDTPSPELDSCAQFIAHYFSECGLEPAGDLEDFFQNFNLSRNVLSAPNSVTLSVSGSKTSYEIKKDFVPLHLTANRKITAPVVFAGYGITAPEHGYDDYENIDVTGKFVLVFTHEPQENDTTSIFHKHRLSDHSKIINKALTATKHGAAGMIVVTDPNNHRFRKPPNSWPSLMRNAPDDAIPLTLEEKMENKIIAVRIGKTLAEAILAPSGKAMTELQTAIDSDLSIHSFEIPDLQVTIETNLAYNAIPTKNVVGLLKGTDPELADEYIVIGGHYDHLGAKGDSVIFNGADDNASGTVGVMALAKAFSISKPKRSILFCAWSGEEKGLFGSRYYVNSDPVIPLEKTVSYFNLDMVGRMDSTEVRISGIHSGDSYREVVEKANAIVGLTIEERPSVSRSDHAPFYDKKIPVMGFDTDFHPDYHQPTDTIEKCSIEGIVNVCKLIYLITEDLANRDNPPVYTEKQAEK